MRNPLPTRSAFISFDYEHDKDIRGSLVSQAQDPKSPFTITDWSLEEPFDEKWKMKVRDIIQRVDLTIVLCGEFTDAAAGVSAEMTIIREENRPYFLLCGRKRKPCKKPQGAVKSDIIHPWNRKTLQKLIDGAQYRK